jgi:hypothetical protein
MLERTESSPPRARHESELSPSEHVEELPDRVQQVRVFFVAVTRNTAGFALSA